MTAERLFVGARLAGDAGRSGADAFAVTGGRFVAVGRRDAVDALRGPATDVVELGGRRVIPGLHDAHTHLSGGALETAGLDLRGCSHPRSVAEAVCESARRLRGGAWIRGFGWDPRRWPAGGRDWQGLLDAAAPLHPTFLSRADGHAAWFNGAAIRAFRAAGVDSGLFGEDGSVRVVEERAAEALRGCMPLPPREELHSALGRVLREAAAKGLTAVQDVVEPWALPVYEELRDAGGLPLRIAAWLPLEADDDDARDQRRRFPPDDPWIAVTTRKVFLDGTLGAGTAALEEPHGAAGGRRGDLRVDPAALLERVRSVDAEGWAVAFHAVGDRAVRIALDTVAALPPGPRALPHRIEHAQLVRRVDLPRILALGVAVSVQPLHWQDDRRFSAGRLTRRTGSIVYPWRSLRAVAASGFAFGTDWPVAALDPQRTLDAVRARASISPPDPEAVTPAEALLAYTEGAAAASGFARDRGRIVPGHRADFLVLEAGVERENDPEEGVDSLGPHRRFLDGIEATV